jgi:hypothetical protein
MSAQPSPARDQTDLCAVLCCVQILISDMA